MAISKNDLTELWDAFGGLHVEIDQRRRLLASLHQQVPLAPEEQHLLHGLGVQLDEMDRILNQANVFIKDYQPPRGSS